MKELKQDREAKMFYDLLEARQGGKNKEWEREFIVFRTRSRNYESLKKLIEIYLLTKKPTNEILKRAI